MGVFDYIHCQLPGVPDVSYHTKDTPEKFLGHYCIEKNGMLMHEEFDLEDRSEAGKWRAEHPDEPLPPEMRSSLSALFGCMTRVNKRWAFFPYTGDIHMTYDDLDLVASFTHGFCKGVYRVPSSTTRATLFLSGLHSKPEDSTILWLADDSRTSRNSAQESSDPQEPA